MATYRLLSLFFIPCTFCVFPSSNDFLFCLLFGVFQPNFSLSSLNLSSTESYTQGCSSFSLAWIDFSWHFLHKTCSTLSSCDGISSNYWKCLWPLFLDPVSLCSYFCETHYSVASWESMHGTWFFWAPECLKMSLVYPPSSLILWLCIEI